MQRPRLLPAVLLAALALSSARGDEPEEKDRPADISKKQDGIRKAYEELEKRILSIAVAISRTDPDKAARLRRAANYSSDEHIAQAMGDVLRLLTGKDFDTANVKQKEIVDALEEVLKILEADDLKTDARLDPKRLERIEKEIRELIEREKKHREESSKAKQLEAEAKALEAAAAKVQGLIEAEKKAIASTQAKPGEALPGVAAEQREVEAKAGDVAKELDALAGKPAEGEAKPGEAKPGEAKPGEAKPGEAKPGEAKPGEAKPGEAKPGEAKPGEAKPGEAKPGEAKPGEAKPGEAPSAGSESASAAAQAVRDAKGSMAQASKKLEEGAKDPALERERDALDKLEKAKDALEKRKMEVERLARFEKMKSEQETTRRDTEDVAKRMGPEKDSGSQGKQGGQKQGGQKQSQGGAVPGQRNVERAEDEMKRAGDDLENRHASNAEEKQDEAVRELEKAAEQVREALIQARRREQEEVLRTLGQMFVAMLAKQRDATKRTEVVDAERADARKKTGEIDPQKDVLPRKQVIEIGKLATTEGELRDDANKALDLIREEGSTAILPTVIAEVGLDLAKLAQLIEKRDTGRFVVALQKDVERSLEELIEVIKKEIEERKGGGGGGGGGGGDDNQEPLLPASAELKMIRAQQLRVNDKTKQFDLGRAPEKDLGDDQREAVRHIAEKQGRVAEFTRKLHMKLNKEE